MNIQGTKNCVHNRDFILSRPDYLAGKLDPTPPCVTLYYHFVIRLSHIDNLLPLEAFRNV